MAGTMRMWWTVLAALWGTWVQGLPEDRRGPNFIYEPPNGVDFSNMTGTVIPCSVRGSPTPIITWETEDGTPVSDVPGLRHVRPDGSLVFTPFRPEDFRPDVHSAVYRCVASSPIGTIVSRDVHVRGVVKLPYGVDVYDEYVIAGNTAVLKCHVPGFVKEHVTITSWIEEPTGHVIQPTGTAGGRYIMFPSGELHIGNVDSSFTFRSYKCQTRHRLTGETLTSATAGRLVVTESRNTVGPRITNSKFKLVVLQGEFVAIPCAARGYPVPTYRWYKKYEDRLAPVELSQRLLQVEGTLFIQEPTVQDSGNYVCAVNNSAGEERAETQVLVKVPISVNIIPSRQSVDIGKTAMFNCTVSGFPIKSVRWEKDHQSLHSGPRIRIITQGLLQVDSVQREDRGMYQCLASNEFESAQATAELHLGDDAPEFRQTFTEQKVQPGPPLSLKCVATGNPLPQITWSLDEAPLPENIRIRFGDYVTKDGAVISFVNISNVQVEDGGDYRCTADNGVGKVSHSARVNVMGPPVVRPMKNLTVVAGEVLVLRCPVAGYPLETINWERAGLRLPYNHRQKVHDNGTLEVHHVERSTDEGPYTCVVRNPKGQSAQSTVYVQVKVKPIIEPFQFPKSLREGQRCSVLCTVASGDMPIKIRWFKDGQPILEQRGIRVNEVADYSSTLLFESVNLEHRGNYTCIASNDAGTVSHTAAMVIHVPPRWVIEPTHGSVVKGRSLSIDCQAEGFPPPRVRWTKAEGDVPRDFKPIVSSPHLQVFENGSLVFHDAQEIDAGFYLCQASNGIGQGLSKVIKITVHIAAHFKSKFTAEMVRKGHSTRLKCEAFGDKPITITWMKDKQPINLKADTRYELVESVLSAGIISEILIRRADRRDSALFTCAASNSFGHDDTNIQLIVQEPPDSPQDVKVIEKTGRAIKFAWSSPYSGNSPITQFFIQYKEENDKFHKLMTNVTLPGSEAIGTVRGLKPAKVYQFRVIAENRLGKSEPSKPIEAMTEEEAPGGPPLKVFARAASSRSVTVVWKPPNVDLQHGVIKGYYVGYRVVDSQDPYVYKTLEVNENFKEECALTNLKRFTKYSIVVQAFNSKGAGPPSEEVVVQTLESDPPTTPSLQVVDSTAFTIQLAWEPSLEDGNPISGYVLHQRQESSEWEEVRLSGDQTSYTASNLKCGTRYQFFLVAFNSAGKGHPSDVMTVRTDGSIPIAPDRTSVITPNITSAIIHLEAWHHGGCPINLFTVRYKAQQQSDWTLISEGVAPDQKQMIVLGLSPATTYQLQMTATNDAGSMEAEYIFSTLATIGDITGPRSVRNRSPPSPLLADLSVIIPVVVSVVVVVILFVVVCFVVRRKNSVGSSHNGGSAYGVRKTGIHEGVQLSDLEKAKIGSGVPCYYPAPYATTQLELDKTNDSTYHQLHDEPLYATVKRTPRPPRSDAHIYHYPVDPTTDSSTDQDNPTSSGVSKSSVVVVRFTERDADGKTEGSSKLRRNSKGRTS